MSLSGVHLDCPLRRDFSRPLIGQIASPLTAGVASFHNESFTAATAAPQRARRGNHPVGTQEEMNRFTAAREKILASAA